MKPMLASDRLRHIAVTQKYIKNRMTKNYGAEGAEDNEKLCKKGFTSA
jgi:hypothetical protein